MSSAQHTCSAVLEGESVERERLLKEHLPQVRYIAKRIHERLPSHVEVEDLVHAGVLGLMDAVYKYDPAKNVQFKSYAQFRIRGAILDSLRGLDWSPRELRKKAREIEQAHQKLEAQFGRPATEAELAAHLRLSLEELQRLLSDLHGLKLGSLEVETCSESGASGVCRYLPDAPEQDPFYCCLRQEMKDLLAAAIGELPSKDRQVLALYYFEELTMKEVGAVMGLGESRVSQIHSSVVLRLRARLQQLLAARAKRTGAPPGRQALAEKRALS